MKFLAQFQACCRRIFRAFADTLPSAGRRDQGTTTAAERPGGTEPNVSSQPRATTPCARFLNSEKKYSRSQGRATYRAFQPALDEEENAVVLSMYRTDGLEAETIWELGRTVLGPSGGRLHGRAELLAGEIEMLPEKVIAAKKFRARFDAEPPRHVTIAPWDDDKENQKLHAMELAGVARLYLL